MATGPGRVVAVVGGKGGVGKSTVAVNLALAWARSGRRVLLVDADLGLGSVEVLVDAMPRHHLGEWLAGEASLDDLPVAIDERVDLLAAGSGTWRLASLATAEMGAALVRLVEWGREYSIILFDAGAGVGPQVLAVTAAAGDIVVVTTTEPTAVTEAYTTLKAARQVNPDAMVWLLVNQAGEAAALDTDAQLGLVCERFLHWRPRLLGAVPSDYQVALSVRDRSPIVRVQPRALASRALIGVAGRLLEGDARAFSGEAVLARIAAIAAAEDGAPENEAGAGETDAPADERGQDAVPQYEGEADEEAAASDDGEEFADDEDDEPDWEEVALAALQLRPNQRVQIVNEDDSQRLRSWVESAEGTRWRLGEPQGAVPVAWNGPFAIEFEDAVARYRLQATLHGRRDGFWEVDVVPFAGRQQRRSFVRWPCSLAVAFRWWAPSPDGSPPEVDDSGEGDPSARAPSDPVAAFRTADAAGLAAEGEGHTEDLSGGGMLLRTRVELSVGALLEARLAPGGRPVAAVGEVVRRLKPRRDTPPGEGRYGVAWREISDGDLDAVVRFIFAEQRMARKQGLA